MAYGPVIAQHVWNWAKNTGIGKKTTALVKEYTGYDLNDHNDELQQ